MNEIYYLCFLFCFLVNADVCVWNVLLWSKVTQGVGGAYAQVQKFRNRFVCVYVYNIYIKYYN